MSRTFKSHGGGKDSVAALINPGAPATVRGDRRPAKQIDFERENRLLIKHQQVANRQKKMEEEATAAANSELFKLQQFKNVKSRFATTKSAPSSTVDRQQSSFLRRGSAEERAEQLRGNAIAERRALEESMPALEQKPKVPVHTETAQLAPRSTVNYIASNRVEAEKPMRTPRGSSREDLFTHKSQGAVPNYLLERKEQWAREEEQRRLNLPDPNAPPGMVLMPEDERQETLRMLDDSKADTEKQLSRMPLVIQTPMMQRRYNDLEAKLAEVQSAIQIFSRPKVYVAK